MHKCTDTIKCIWVSHLNESGFIKIDSTDFVEQVIVKYGDSVIGTKYYFESGKEITGLVEIKVNKYFVRRDYGDFVKFERIYY